MASNPGIREAFPPDAEWLEADGLGGFASGTVSGIRTRRYHALLLTATQPPAGRYALVNGFEATVRTPAGDFALSSQRYQPGVIHPDGASRIVSFSPDPWPRWSYQVTPQIRIEQEIVVPHELPGVVLRWRLVSPAPGVTLEIRPLLSGRDPHATHHENPAFRFEPAAIQRETNQGAAMARGAGAALRWHPYDGLPSILALASGRYAHQPDWYRGFFYAEEAARGLDAVEDLAVPGCFTFDLSGGDASLILAAEGEPLDRWLADHPAGFDPAALLEAERRRRDRFPSRLHRAADAYLVRRGPGRTIIAGYPWFGDWGRDTFIALRGLCLATGKLEEAGAILLEWTKVVSEGMLPNRFPDSGGEPEYNSVDASLWFIVAVHDYLAAMKASGRRLAAGESDALRAACDSILDGYTRGTRFGIGADGDGLLRAGVPGAQLTWMDAKVGDWVVTPRAGKPVEVQALWLNALRIASSWSHRWEPLHARGLSSFGSRFWNESAGGLFDVVDVAGESGHNDASVRPNQIFAVGGLPFPLLAGSRARRVVDTVERLLLTPLGLRSLAPMDAAYAPRYEGGVRERDGAYHQGTVWPWLAGPFVEAWLRVRENGAATQEEARRRFLDPLIAHLDEAGLGHISEIADAEPPFTPRGCPFQAWSVGEALRIASLLEPRR